MMKVERIEASTCKLTAPSNKFLRVCLPDTSTLQSKTNCQQTIRF